MPISFNKPVKKAVKVLGGIPVAVSFLFLFAEARKNVELEKRVTQEGFESLNTAELKYYMKKRKSHWGGYESAYYASQRGVFDQSEWSNIYSSMCRDYLLEPIIWKGMDYGEGLSHSLTPEFRLYIEYSCQ